MHVVVSGQVRHFRCYRALLKRVADAQDAGTVQSTTLVHWKDQADLVRGLASAHGDRFELVFMNQPELLSPGHFYHQTLTFHEGMSARAPDDLVLRLRPDIFGEAGFLEAIAGVLAGSDKALWTPHADLTCPFFANDIVFGGRAEALRAQTNFSVEPLLTVIPAGSERKPTKVYSHEPEIQRWLHPARDEDWATRVYWRTFASFGLASLYRIPLMRRFQTWDFFAAIRLRWLRYLAREVALGGIEDGPKFGLVRTETDSDDQGKVLWMQALSESHPFDPSTVLETEATAFAWTTSSRNVETLRAFCEDRATPERRLTATQAQDELAAFWREALTEEPATEKMVPPVIGSHIVY